MILVSTLLSAATLPPSSTSLLEVAQSVRSKYSLPSLAVARISGDRPPLISAVGVRKIDDPNQTPVTSGDLYHLGSCTKSMTATLLAVLIERGQLEWSSRLGEIYPTEFSAGTFHPNLRDVTLEMLGAHRSGISGAHHPGPEQSRAEFAASTLSSPPTTQPGSTFEYSNANQIILGAIMEKVTGKTWESLMITEVFKPLGMPSCGFGVQASRDLEVGTDPDSVIPSQPWPHYQESPQAPIFPIPPTLQADNPASLGPAGTVHCSIDDWGKYAHLHMAGARGQITPILNSKSFIKLHTPYPGQDYTPGGWIRLEREWANGHVLTHSGSNTLNYASIWIAPQQERGTAYLAASNLGGEKAGEALNEAISSLIELP
jgi:CubicO group peptidase (beta-lactamase class C family)